MGSLKKGSDPVPTEITEEGCKTPAESLNRNGAGLGKSRHKLQRHWKVINQGKSNMTKLWSADDRGRETTCLNNNGKEQIPWQFSTLSLPRVRVQSWLNTKILKVTQHGQRKRRTACLRGRIEDERHKDSTTILFDDDDDGLSQCSIPDYVSKNLLPF